MRRDRYRLAGVLLMTAAVLTGCSTLDRIVGVDEWKDWTPSSTALQVQGDGSVIETIIDRLDESWYTGDELQDMIARSMNEYNASHGENVINVTAYSDEGGDVSVTVLYRTQEDYAAFNNVPLFNGPMLDAQIEGYLFQGSFYRVEGTELALVNTEEPLSHKEYDVCISDGEHAVQVPGEIRYVSGQAAILNSHTVMPAEPAAQADSSEDALTDDEETAEGTDPAGLYIIYEKDQDPGPGTADVPDAEGSGQEE